MPTLTLPRVTVFIPVHNRQHYIASAVDSILAQTFEDFELLVVDDGSTDATLEVLSRYRDPRLRVECNSRNLGIPATRNRGLDLARGEYIALLDSDDKAWPNRLARQVEVLDRHPELVQIGSACDFMDANGRRLRKVRRQPLDPDEVDASLAFYCALTNRTIMARTAILREYRYNEDFPRCQDYELHQRLSRTQRMANLGDVLVCGREHDGRFTRQTDTLGRERKHEICRRALLELGIEPSEEDLDRHYALSRPQKLGTALNRDYLDWTEQWLAQLDAANRRTQRHVPEALLRVMTERWVQLCLHARRQLGPGAYLRLLRSPLARRLPAAGLRFLRTPRMNHLLRDHS
ncbi:glycosyltransferase family 2 protein [Azotobacter chroococcum]|uniref:glycosyltransferase family 2 protein n=1 Tax=Azotobacter chroococcum TaxID=353 RepID=UPI000B5F06CA|nr:glycosyltransferase family A protein [Azotobacter chroococcum]ASL26520.1 family 2 glycosyl transferase [Azotobacter chroococcum]